MEVLLHSDVENLGEMGDVVDVADGYARNYLLPQKLAVKVTAANLNIVEKAQEAKREREQDELQRLKAVGEKLVGFLCYIEMRAPEEGHLFGSVGPEQVAEVMAASGFDAIRPSNVNMPAHVEQVGASEVEIMLHPQVRVSITLRVAPLGESEGED